MRTLIHLKTSSPISLIATHVPNREIIFILYAQKTQILNTLPKILLKPHATRLSKKSRPSKAHNIPLFNIVFYNIFAKNAGSIMCTKHFSIL